MTALRSLFTSLSRLLGFRRKFRPAQMVQLPPNTLR